MNLRASNRGSGEGQALTEFALVIPIFLLLLLAVFDIGRGVFLYNGLTNAAREGARLAIVNQDKSLVSQRVQAMTFAGVVSNAGNLNDLVSFHRSSPNTDPLTNPECTTPDVGCIAVVTARSDWSMITPVIGSIIGTVNLKAQSEMPIEFTCPNANIPAYTSSASCPRQP